MKADFVDLGGLILTIAFPAISSLDTTRIVFKKETRCGYFYFIVKNALAWTLNNHVSTATSIAPFAALVHSAEPLM